MKPKIVNPEVTHHIVRTFQIQAKKRLGQNFLISPRILEGILDAGEVAEGDLVLEVGPGIGTLTQGLAERGAEVIAVEIDETLLPILAKTLEGYQNVRIVHGDILKVNIPELLNHRPCKLVANLPYYITTPIIMGLIESRYPFTHLVAMVQKEVAERMAATPGGKEYGALSVAVQYFTEPKIALHVPPGSFLPSPAVESAVVCCARRTMPPVTVQDEKHFFRVVKAAFGQRRKTLANALKGGGFGGDTIKTALDSTGIDTGRRGETLSMNEFATIANAIYEIQKQ